MKQKVKSISAKNDWRGYVFVAPLVLLFAVFMLYSFFFLAKNGFYKLTLSFSNSEFVGFKNYAVVFSDKQFWRGIRNNFVIASFTIFVSLTLGYVMGVFLMFQFRGKKWLHGLFFIPTMVPMALLATVFGSMLEYKNGTLNELLRSVGLDFLAKRWLVDPNLAMCSVMSISIFIIGIPIMYYGAGIATVNTSVFEAALIDGAGMRQILTLILYPILKNTHYTVILSMLLGGFREFERVYLLTNGGPGGKTEISGTYIYTYVRTAGANLGLVCAASMIILGIAFIISFLQIKLSAKEER